MANVPPIPPGSGPRTEVPLRAANRPHPAGGLPFRALLARGRAQAPVPPTGSRPAPVLPRRADAQSPAAVPEAPLADVEGRDRRAAAERDEGDDGERVRFGVDPLDPMTRALFSDGSQRLAFERPAAPATNPPPQPDPASVAARVSLEHVMSRFVRRVAWSGDANAGTARLELGAGALAGATLTIHSELGAVRVALELPPGVDGAEWRERIARRLEARGLQIAALDVD